MEKLKFHCQKVLPLVYDDSLSYYEVVCKVVNKLNEVVENENNLTEAMSELEGEIGRVIISFHELEDDFSDLEKAFEQFKVDILSTFEEKATEIATRVSTDKISEMLESVEFKQLVENYVYTSVVNSVAKQWYSREWKLGEICFHNKKVYICITFSTQDEPNDSGYPWKQITIGEIIYNNYTSIVYEHGGSNLEYVTTKTGFYLITANTLTLTGISYLEILINNSPISSVTKNSETTTSLTTSRVAYLGANSSIKKQVTNCEERDDAYNTMQVVYLGNNYA